VFAAATGSTNSLEGISVRGLFHFPTHKPSLKMSASNLGAHDPGDHDHSAAHDGNDRPQIGKEILLAAIKLLLRTQSYRAGTTLLEKLSIQPPFLLDALELIHDISGPTCTLEAEFRDEACTTCADLLEKRAKVLYPMLPVDKQSEFRSSLLSLIRDGTCWPDLCYVVTPVAAVVAKSDDDWPELFQTIATVPGNVACVLAYEVRE
jgi:hypothetical protein